MAWGCKTFLQNQSDSITQWKWIIPLAVLAIGIGGEKRKVSSVDNECTRGDTKWEPPNANNRFIYWAIVNTDSEKRWKTILGGYEFKISVSLTHISCEVKEVLLSIETDFFYIFIKHQQVHHARRGTWSTKSSEYRVFISIPRISCIQQCSRSPSASWDVHCLLRPRK